MILWIASAIAFLGGYWLPEALLGVEQLRLLGPFFGILSLGILPSITLLVGNMTASTKSVAALRKTHLEMRRLITGLFWLLGLVSITVVLAIALTVPWPQPEVSRTAGQDGAFQPVLSHLRARFEPALRGLFVLVLFHTINRTWLIVRAVDVVFKLKSETAIAEAEEATQRRASELTPISMSFGRAEGFGARRPAKLVDADGG